MRFSRTLWISSILASCALSAAETEPGDAPTSQVSGGHNDQNTKQGASTIATASGSGDDSSAAAQSESNEEEASSDGLGEGRRIARVVISSPDGEVEGEASVAWKADEGTTIQLDLSKGLVDTDEAQYKWHFHQKPVTGACSTTGGHLDPTGASAECDASMPWMCQEGDLSGKHGAIPGSADGSASVSITDAYVRWEPEAFSVLGRSLVIHDAKGEPWACGNVSSVLDGTATEDNLPSNATSSYQTYPESDWPTDIPEDNVGWTPSIQEAPQVSVNVDDTGKRVVTVGRLTDDADNSQGGSSVSNSGSISSSTVVSVNDIASAEEGGLHGGEKGSQPTDSGLVSKSMSGSSGTASGASQSQSDAASSAATNSDADTEDSSAQALATGVGLAGAIALYGLCAL